jgi:hypothetical protein
MKTAPAQLRLFWKVNGYEDDFVQKQLITLAPEDQMVFMMAYECFVMWALKLGIEKVLQRDEVESACLAIQTHFAKHAWYRPDAFEKIWQQMQVFFSLAMTWDRGGQPPITFAEIVIAAQQAGYPFNFDPDIGFAMIYVSTELVRLTSFGEIAAKQHLERKRT